MALIGNFLFAQPTTELGLRGGHCIVLGSKYMIFTGCLLLNEMLCCYGSTAYTVPFCDQHNTVHLPDSHSVGKSVTGLITLRWGGAISTVGIRNFILRMSQVRKRAKIGFSQSLMCIHPFLPLSLCFLLSTPLQPSSQKKLFFLIPNIVGGAFSPSHVAVPSYACVCRYQFLEGTCVPRYVI